MSARLLKKVLKEQEQHLQYHQQQEEEEEEEETESPYSSSRPVANPFDLLYDDDSDQENEIEISDDTRVNNTDKQESLSMQNMGDSVTLSKKKSKKKKKKKTKVTTSSGTSVDDRLLNEALETVSLDVNSFSKQRDHHKNHLENARLIKQFASSILQVDPKFLNPENELRRIFGSKVVKSFERGNQTSSSRQLRGLRRGVHHIKKTILISPSEHWPRWDRSLTMEFLETKDGYNYFRYVHSSSYDQAQRAFEAAKAIHDRDGIASILLHHPYHLDSLIAMADYFKSVGEHQMSADAIAKSLYALECAWHPLFTPLQGNCQLKMHHVSNKPMFSTLSNHMKNMDRRGCHRSALEICKLLLSLDLDYPMGALFCIDYFALRANQYAWLEQFSEEFKRVNSLWPFPNFLFSLAICRYYLEQEERAEDTAVPVMKASSSDLMKQALMLHPYALKKLVAKVPLKDQAWINILKHAFFQSEESGSSFLDDLISIYVERNYIVWRLLDLQKLLRVAALQVIETLKHNSSEAKDWVLHYFSPQVSDASSSIKRI